MIHTIAVKQSLVVATLIHVQERGLQIPPYRYLRRSPVPPPLVFIGQLFFQQSANNTKQFKRHLNFLQAAAEINC